MAVTAIMVEGRAKYQWTRLAMAGNSSTANVATIDGIQSDGWLALAMLQQSLNGNSDALTH